MNWLFAILHEFPMGNPTISTTRSDFARLKNLSKLIVSCCAYCKMVENNILLREHYSNAFICGLFSLKLDTGRNQGRYVCDYRNLRFAMIKHSKSFILTYLFYTSIALLLT